MNNGVWVVSYEDRDGRFDTVMFDNEIHANLCYVHAGTKGYKNVKVCHVPVFEKFLWDGHMADGKPVHVKEKGVPKMVREYTKIYCCGDCINYDWKKHKCKRGASEEGKPTDNFYRDCPNGLFEEEAKNK